MLAMRKLSIIFTGLVLSVFITDSLYAMRCGNRLIQKEDHVSKIERYCDVPVSYQSSTAYVGRERYDYRYRQFFYEEVPVQIEIMVFNFGPSKFMREVRLENGIVTRIKRLDYGYRE